MLHPRRPRLALAISAALIGIAVPVATAKTMATAGATAGVAPASAATAGVAPASAATAGVARASATTARTVTQTARSGGLSASFSFRHTSGISYGHLALTIRSGGRVQYSAPVTSPFCHGYCEPGNPSANGASIGWRRLDPTGRQLVLDLYSGGAHCCSIVQVFSQAPGSSRWTKSSFDFGDPGYELIDLAHDGTDEFLTADDRFAYAFTDYAASGMPLLIERWSDGHFVNVTRSYPDRIRHDAAVWMKAFTSQRHSHYADTTGVIAAWAADEDELGNTARVASFLEHAAAAGELNSGLGNSVPENARFVAALNRFLRRCGYLQ